VALHDDWVLARFRRPTCTRTLVSAAAAMFARSDTRRTGVSISIISEAQRRFEADPAAALGTPTVTATLTEGRASLSSGPFKWDADLPAVLGGSNVAPSPTAYLLGALAGCAVAFLRDTLAPEFDVHVDGITAVARCSTDARGLVGMPGTSPELGNVELEILVATKDPSSKTGPMFDAWQERCPIFLALLRPVPVALKTSIV
jgi:uncharacterized OsmC-like protein